MEIQKLLGDQQDALDYVLNFVNDTNAQSMVLEGGAGVGKTSLVSKIIKRVNKKIILATPTHKAKDVIREKVNSVVSAVTIHSLLNMQQIITSVIDKKGRLIKKEVFKPVKSYKKIQLIELVNLLIVDEASMISTELRGYLYNAMNKYKFKTLFIGDIAQLPPIGEKQSEIFNNANTFTMNSILRQALDNPIIKALTDLRINSEINFKTDINNKKEGIRVCDNYEFIDHIKKEFKLGDNHNIKIIAWTNDAVQTYNNYIRQYLYGANTEHFQPGEFIMANDRFGILNSKTSIINNSEELEILSSEPFDLKLYDGFNIRAFNLQVKQLRTGKRVEQAIPVPHPDDRNKFKIYVKQLYKNALKNTSQWGKYFIIKNHTVANVDYSYAITSHKSQGSTYDRVFVDKQNILTNWNREEAIKSLYVAMSRTKQQLWTN